MQPRPPILTFQSCPWDNPLFVTNIARIANVVQCHSWFHVIMNVMNLSSRVIFGIRFHLDSESEFEITSQHLVQFDSINWSSHLVVMVAERSLSCHQHNTDSGRVQSLFGQCPEQGTQFPPKNTQSIATHPIAHRWANCAEKWLSIKYRVIKIKCYWLKIRAWTLLKHYFH